MCISLCSYIASDTIRLHQTSDWRWHKTIGISTCFKPTNILHGKLVGLHVKESWGDFDSCCHTHGTRHWEVFSNVYYTYGIMVSDSRIQRSTVSCKFDRVMSIWFFFCHCCNKKEFGKKKIYGIILVLFALFVFIVHDHKRSNCTFSWNIVHAAGIDFTPGISPEGTVTVCTQGMWSHPGISHSGLSLWFHNTVTLSFALTCNALCTDTGTV